MLRFKRALRSSGADRVARLTSRVWHRFWTWYFKDDRYRVWWEIEWVSVHTVPIFPPWRWAWKLPPSAVAALRRVWPWAVRRSEPAPQTFWIQLTVLKFNFQFTISTQDSVKGRPLSQMITIAALVWSYFARCA